MIDLHCHILPGLDDGAKTLADSLAMARMFVADGVTHVACTPHIMPGVYNNTGQEIRKAIKALQTTLDAEGIELQLLTGADNHIVPEFVAGLREGHLLALGDSRYVLVEPPHHVAPPRLEDFFFSIVVAGYVPILTHPERLSWIEAQYATLQRLVDGGVWMQVTSGSLAGRFGKRSKALAQRMLEDGLVHILATDSHDTANRPPTLSEGWHLACACVGEEEAERLVLHRPFAIVCNEPPSTVEGPTAMDESLRVDHAFQGERSAAGGGENGRGGASAGGLGRISRRLRKFFK